MRENAGKTREEVAEAAKMSMGTVQKIEADALIKLDAYLLAEFAKAINADLHYIMFGVSHGN